MFDSMHKLILVGLTEALRGKVQSPEVAAATTSPPSLSRRRAAGQISVYQPLADADNTEKGNDDVEESGDDDTNAEESGGQG
ncbi:hypothetical protein HAX54_041974 [Datura stramonium]|uniref:Uncharacterized protein n=1 Tax=Datura stramonium TaxID=4076 RepID=A0ABS8VY81_DATST|nr:hypothetical protein [Datura stramonium]